MIIAATGHRPDKLGREYDMDGPYSSYISQEIGAILDEYSPEACISGMALGVDTIFAIEALHRKIPVIAAIPFKGQESAWLDKSKDIYDKIINHKLVTKRYICEPGYAAYKMQVRNEWMVDNCNMLIAVWDTTPGGTANCVKYAAKKNRETIFIDPRNYSD